MQTVNTLMPVTFDTSPSSWESGPVSAEKASGLTSVPDTWMAVMENMTAKILAIAESMNPAEASSRPGDRVPTETEQKHVAPAAEENKAAVIIEETGLPIFAQTTASATVLSTFEKQVDSMAPQGTHPEPAAQLRGETRAINSRPIPPFHEGAPATGRFHQPEHDVQAPAPEPGQGSERYPAVSDPNSKHPITPVKNPLQPPMPPPADHQPEKQQPANPQLERQQLERPYALNPTEAILPDNHLGKDHKKTAARARPPALAEAGSEKQFSETGRPLAMRPAFQLPRTAVSGTPFDIGRPAPSGDHAHWQHSATAMPAAGRHAPSPAVVAELSATGTSLIRDDGTALRIEHPLWSAAGIREMPVGADGRIHPDADFPPAVREMRILSDVIEKAYWHQDNGRAQARIQIKPAFLGHLHLTVLADQSRVSVEIRVENPLTREFVEMNLQTLKTDLQASGLDVDKIDVVVDPHMDDHREQYREPDRKQNRHLGASADMAESATAEKKDLQNTKRPTEDTENSINCFA
jgi:hypothetical protein